jgi:hypothetical protein
MAFSTNPTDWYSLFLTIAATCALPSLVVGYVGMIRPALVRAKSRQDVIRSK